MPIDTINISFTSTDWRGVALSNFSLSPFVLDGVLLASIEGFIQGTKHPPGHPSRAAAFIATAWEAKACGRGAARDVVYWGGNRFRSGQPLTTVWSNGRFGRNLLSPRACGRFLWPPGT